ncbi:MAG: aminotransferase class III-fold pyridoxal phosphate-dependent enzyme [Myxococcota bacterium]|nr:aminotransferase class III-fold pyridoxal phosphate-dependent enzyme [Myxococcota bacterium]
METPARSPSRPTPPGGARHARSLEHLHRALAVIPGGHHLSGRTLVDPRSSPMYFERAKGARIWDVDGHEYIDFLLAYGAFVLGYADEEVDRAAFAQATRGNLVSMNHPLHIRFIEALLERFPAADMGVFLKTGSEATTAALRIARRATGRRMVARCGYHGWHDWCLPQDDSVASGLDSQILEFRGDDPATLEALFAGHPGEIAAVILAPEMVMPLTAPPLLALLEATRAHGAVFVLDEVKTAFRTSPGSIQTRLGLEPDLTTLSKAVGNGWPVAAVIGKRAVMEHAAGMHLSATYHGETSAMAAALETMRILERDQVADHVWKMGARLIDGLNALVRTHDAPAVAYGEPLPPMPFLRFRHPDPALIDAVRATFYTEVLSRGVLLHPRHLWFVSRDHQPADIDRALEACDQGFRAARRKHPQAFG